MVCNLLTLASMPESPSFSNTCLITKLKGISLTKILRSCLLTSEPSLADCRQAYNSHLNCYCSLPLVPISYRIPPCTLYWMYWQLRILFCSRGARKKKDYRLVFFKLTFWTGLTKYVIRGITIYRSGITIYRYTSSYDMPSAWFVSKATLKCL